MATPTTQEIQDSLARLKRIDEWVKRVSEFLKSDDGTYEMFFQFNAPSEELAKVNWAFHGPTRIQEAYWELLYNVARKHPGESRHETALRYIKEREAAANDPTAEAQGKVPQG